MRVDVEMLKAEMDKQNMTISDLAEASDVDKSTISRLLNEQRTCSVNTAQALVQALNISSVKAGKIFFGR